MEKKPQSTHSKTYRKLQAEKFSRTYLLLVLLLVSLLFFNVIKIFLIPILLAAVFTSLFYPLYEKLLKAFRNQKSLSAIVCCVILLLGLIIPVYVVADLVYREAVNLYQSAVPTVKEIIEKGDEGLLGDIKNYPLFQRLELEKFDWQSSLQDVVKNAGNLIVQVLNKTWGGTFQAVGVITDLFITLFTMFYFFRDGDRLLQRIKYLSPLEDVYEEGLIYRFVSISRATVKGTLLIGIIQGTVGGLTLWLFGVESPILWAVVMVILSVIPLVGAWLVLYPAAIVQLILGNVWQGVGIIIVTVVVIANIDNLLRPRLVGRDAGMHDLMIFFSTLGGLSLFGIMGFIIGPVIAVFFLTILDIYSIEFKSTLDFAQSSRRPSPQEEEPPRIEPQSG